MAFCDAQGRPARHRTPTACGCEARPPFAPGNCPHKTPPAKSPADLSCNIYSNKNIGVLLFLTM